MHVIWYESFKPRSVLSLTVSPDGAPGQALDSQHFPPQQGFSLYTPECVVYQYSTRFERMGSFAEAEGLKGALSFSSADASADASALCINDSLS